jgi:hypothetical protein
MDLTRYRASLEEFTGKGRQKLQTDLVTPDDLFYSTGPDPPIKIIPVVFI